MTQVNRSMVAGMELSLPTLAALILLSVAPLCAQGMEVLKLDLAASPLGSPATGGSELPLVSPSRIEVSPPDEIAIEEEFSTAVDTLAGRSLVFRRQSADGRCGIDFLFVGPGLPAEGVIALKTRLLSETSQQRGNIMFQFRDQKKDLVFYLQMGPKGTLGVSTSANPKENVSLGILPSPNGLTDLEIVLDFSKREVSVLVNSKQVGDSVPLDDSLPIMSFSLGVNGKGAMRTFAIRSLVISQK